MRHLSDFGRAVATGPRLVLTLPKFRKEMEKEIPPVALAALERLMQFHAEDRDLPPSQFKAEQRFPVGHDKSLHVWAFKWKTFRVYGAHVTIEGYECFVCSELANKKSQKADMEKLKSAATKIWKFLEEANA